MSPNLKKWQKHLVELKGGDSELYDASNYEIEVGKEFDTIVFKKATAFTKRENYTPWARMVIAKKKKKKK